MGDTAAATSVMPIRSRARPTVREAGLATKWLVAGVGVALVSLVMLTVVFVVTLLCLTGVGLLLVRPVLLGIRTVADAERSRLRGQSVTESSRRTKIFRLPRWPPYATLPTRRAHPKLAVLVLSAYVEQSFATDLLAEGAGRVGYLLKERVGRVDTFVEALQRVTSGGTAIDPDVVAQLFSRQRADHLDELSERERDVLAKMAEGLGNTAIAERLFITENAVHKHIRSIFMKLRLPTDSHTDRRVAAVLRYLDENR